MDPRFAHAVARLDGDRATMRCGRIASWADNRAATDQRQRKPTCPDCLAATHFAIANDEADDFFGVLFV